MAHLPLPALRPLSRLAARVSPHRPPRHKPAWLVRPLVYAALAALEGVRGLVLYGAWALILVPAGLPALPPVVFLAVTLMYGALVSPQDVILNNAHAALLRASGKLHSVRAARGVLYRLLWRNLKLTLTYALLLALVALAYALADGRVSW